ncbi:S8 family serine peptidase [Arthrobacter sp. PsM3]|uniref:S8 family serine peptidase n=1 Tax=Arthrobacter sp. PsM3 TaxID=3030531 RepID=UPI00263B0ADF|nr:S8 family serine peptidase [Arthrobacter sp. PsM3]
MDNVISIAGRTLDPLVEQDIQSNVNEPVDLSGEPAWIVQFFETLSAEATDQLRSEFGLKLAEYVPRNCYIEVLAPATAAHLRGDDRVRAVMQMTNDLKVSAELRNDEQVNEPTASGPIDVIAFNAQAESVLAQVQRLIPPERIVAVIDERPLGGKFLIRITGNSATAARIAEMQGVRWVQEVPETSEDRKDIAGDPMLTTAGRIPEIERLRLTGAGQVIGIIDNGPPDLDHCFFIDTENPQPGPEHRKVVLVRNSDQRPTGKHATFTCGIAAGDEVGSPGMNPQRGVASGARLACGNVSDVKTTSTIMIELAAASESGAIVHSNSWHAKPQGVGRPATYDAHSAGVDTFTSANEDHVVVGSSGNSDEEQGPPGTAKNALCVSATAVGQPGDTVGDGSPGPTADGRRKPDLTGVGCGVVSAHIGTPCELSPASVPCASSYATPWVAAVLTLVRQQLTEGRYRDGDQRPEEGFVPTAALIRAIALNSAVAAGNNSDIPSRTRGWGALNPLAALGQHAPRLLLDVRNADGLVTGTTCRLQFSLAQTSPLAVTLNWTEPPGTIGSDNSIVNDLDLRVTAPDGEVFLGNNLVAGQSAPGGVPDTLNPTEMVVVDGAQPGQWTAEVIATEINFGPTQGFALVVSAAITPDSESTDSERRVRQTRPIP